jgi:putative tryptophan/tyrosine transport system substrate-binding protein
MRRREFIILLGRTAIMWPLVARAQQPDRMRRVGVLMNRRADNPQGHDQLAAFQEALQKLGWNDGHNVRIDICWGENDVDRDRQCATELVALMPDVVLASGTLGAISLQHIQPKLSVVFVQIADPVGSGIVDSLARPGGTTTGFINYEFSLAAKWVEVLKQIAPNVTRALVIRDSSNPAGIGQFSAIQGAAQSRGVEVSPIGVRDAGEIERAVTTFARSANGGLIVTGPAGGSVYRELIIQLATRHKLPAVYADSYIVAEGGLISYGSNRIDQFRQAANYVDRILRGEKPADLPVQTPTKYELAINLRTAKALGLTVPQALLALADQVIE